MVSAHIWWRAQCHTIRQLQLHQSQADLCTLKYHKTDDGKFVIWPAFAHISNWSNLTEAIVGTESPSYLVVHLKGLLTRKILLSTGIRHISMLLKDFNLESYLERRLISKFSPGLRLSKSSGLVIVNFDPPTDNIQIRIFLSLLSELEKLFSCASTSTSFKLG